MSGATASCAGKGVDRRVQAPIFCDHLAKAAAAVLLGMAMARAEPPKLEALFPAGGQTGSSFVMNANGRLDADARLWTDAAGVFFVPTGKQREWQVTIAAQAQPGLYLVHASNKDGASEPRWFSIGTLAEMSETEPNDEPGKGQTVDKLPVCINGRLDKSGDVDGFTVKLEAGQTLVGLVEGYALGSPVDIMAHVVDEQGVRVLTASDARNLDPTIVFTAPKQGSYTVQLAGFTHPPASDVRFTGGAAVVYRLHLTNGPVVTQVFPAVIGANGKAEVEMRGHNLDPKKLRHTVEAAALRQQQGIALIMPPNALVPLQVVTADKPAAIEQEPNNTQEQAMAVQHGVIAGEIGGKNDVDRFAVNMKKGDRMQAQVWSKRLGLPLDAQLKIEAPDGKVLATNDDQSADQPDPVAQWTASVDGPHQITVQDLFDQGGSDKSYVLEIGQPSPGFDAKLPDAKPLLIEAGKAISVKVQVKLLNGLKDPLLVRAANLPPGVHAPEVPVPEKGGDVEFKIHAATNAPAGGQLISIAIWTKGDVQRMQPALVPLRGENLRGTSLLDTTTGGVWLTVKAAK